MADGEIGFAIGLSPDYQPVSDSLQKNIDDFRQVVVLETLLGQANAVASMTFDTSDAALSAGDTLAAELHEQAVAAVENNQRALWRTLRDLRQAVITDARERAARLPEMVTPADGMKSCSVTACAIRHSYCQRNLWRLPTDGIRDSYR